MDAEGHKHWSASSTVLRGVVGSTAHGLAIADGTEDRDEMGVCVEPIEYWAGLTQFEQYVYRTAVEREQNKNARSQAGDLDLTIYTLRKYVRLALKGNPSILALLFLPEYTVLKDAGIELRALVPSIISKRAGSAFLGYMQAQKQRLLGEQGGRHGTRHFSDGVGYDTKYATHILRLGYQGIELMETGWLKLPMVERDLILSVRRGEVDQNVVMETAGVLERGLKDAISTSVLQEAPDTELVEEWMVGVYRSAWRKEQ